MIFYFMSYCYTYFYLIVDLALQLGFEDAKISCSEDKVSIFVKYITLLLSNDDIKITKAKLIFCREGNEVNCSAYKKRYTYIFPFDLRH